MYRIEDDHIQQLGEQMHAGSESAFAELYQQTRRTCFQYALRMLKNKEDAEEATNDGYFKLWTNRHQWDPAKGRFVAWMWVVLKRRIIDMHRTKIQHIQAAPRHIDHPDKIPPSCEIYYTDPTPEPLDALIHAEQLQAVYQALLQIEEPSHRIAWRLRMLEGYKFREIGDILKVPLGTAKVWYYRGNEKLKAILG